MIQHDGPAARILVRLGQRVRQGELIGRAEQPESLNVHAPLAGQITGVNRVDTAHAADVPAVEITSAKISPSGHADRAGPVSSSTEPANAAGLADVADRAGLTNFAHPAIPLGRQLRQAASQGIHDVIINAMEAEPMLTADDLTVAESLDMIIAAGVWVRGALNARRIWLAVDRANRRQVSHCRSATAGTPLRVVRLRNKYPQGAPILLALTVLGRETPCGRSPVEANVFIVGVAALAALAAAVLHGRPMVDRVVTVTGPAAGRPGHYRIPVGTTFADVMRHIGLRRPVAQVVDGGPMTGKAVESLDAVVTKRTCAILLLDRDSARIPRPGPCVRCGWCQEDCPVGLDPQALLNLMDRGEVTKSARFHPQACIECGVCSYICPAELPLAQAAADLKRLTLIGAHAS